MYGGFISAIYSAEYMWLSIYRVAKLYKLYRITNLAN